MYITKERYKKIIKWGIVALILVLVVIYGCPIYRITGFPCPCCGTTRAWICFFRGEWKKAFEYHPLFLFFPILIIVYIFDENDVIVFKKKNWVYLIMGIAVLIVYGIRIYKNLIIY